ncbi:high affinity copper uptake protein 1-like [Paramacrobiotus metropolitanus]|uniref:high affinity copper uptake protein 1-like n=1 Tax=Paramacrobiotus metropolitanus TaxID=2943436 RepID=UPI002445A165|nr:high affinity copper uptake protein 1-like [Paramacrobiotus metropolitanus]
MSSHHHYESANYPRTMELPLPVVHSVDYVNQSTSVSMQPSMSMPMYFNFQIPGYILFYLWAPRRDTELIWSVFVVLGMALVLESSKKFRELISRWDGQRVADLLKAHPQLSAGIWLRLVFRRYHLLETLLHGEEMVLSYFLMLIAMTFNVWLFVAMTAGTVLGYFIMTPLTSRDKRPAPDEAAVGCRHGTGICRACGKNCGNKCQKNCDTSCL